MGEVLEKSKVQLDVSLMSTMKEAKVMQFHPVVGQGKEMNKMKQGTISRLFAASLAVVAGLAMMSAKAVTAQAADGDNNQKLTLTGKYVSGRTYKALKIGDYMEADTGGNSITVRTTKDADLNTAASDALKKTLPDGTTFNDPIGYVSDNWNVAKDTSSDKSPAYDGQLRKFVTNLWDEQKIKELMQASTYSATGSKEGAVFNIPEGIYLIVDATDKSTVQTKDTAATIPMLVSTTNHWGANINGQTSTIEIKAPQPDTPDKTTDKPSYNVGDKITFTIKTTVPLYTGFKADDYILKVNDQMSQGLTYDQDLVNEKITVGEKTLQRNVDYTLTATGTKGAKLVFDLSKFIRNAINEGNTEYAGQPLVITYVATLNEDAITMKEGDVHNQADVDFSNDPDSSDSGTTDSGSTPVYTYGFQVKKVNRDDETKVVPGTKFEIFSDNDLENPLKLVATASETSTSYRPPMASESNITTTEMVVPSDGYLRLNGFAEGNYTVKETNAADGYRNMGTTFAVTIKATYDAATKKITELSYGGGKDSIWDLVSLGKDKETDPYANTYVVRNVRSLTDLPLTGAGGIIILLSVGLVLLGAGSVLGISIRRHQKKQSGVPVGSV